MLRELKVPTSSNLFWAMGDQNIHISKAIAELVDNSYDAKIDRVARVEISITDEVISVQDFSKGMNERDLTNALTLAVSNREERSHSIGKYGFGLKTATTRIGNEIEIYTSTREMKKALKVVLSNPSPTGIQSFKGDRNEKWEIPLQFISKEFTCGTNIKIKKLKRRKIEKKDIEGIKKHLSKTFSKFLTDGSLILFLNDEEVKPFKFDVVWSERFSIEVNNLFGVKCKARGWVGVLDTQKNSTTSHADNGFHLYINGRYLESRWIGIENHPEMRLLGGEIFLEGFQSNFTKTEVIMDSEEWREFETYFKAWLKEYMIRGKVDLITRYIRGQKKKKITKQLQDWFMHTEEKIKMYERDKRKIKDHSMGNQKITDSMKEKDRDKSQDKERGNQEPLQEKEVEEPTAENNDYLPKKDDEQQKKQQREDLNENSDSKENVSSNKGALESPLRNDTKPIVLREEEVIDYQTSINVEGVEWRVIFKEGGKGNEMFDLNFYEKIMTLDTRHELFSRYLSYIVELNGENIDKHLLYVVYAIGSTDNIYLGKKELLSKVNKIIYFGG